MGRRRKLVELEQIVTANENKGFNSSSETESGVEKLHLHADNSNAIDVHQVSNGVKWEKISKVGSVVVRRSNRIKSLASPTASLGVELEHVNLVEDEKEQVPEVEQVSGQPKVSARSLEKKVDYLVRVADDFKSKVSRRQDEVPCPDISYKSLYINSQKKIEALVEENYELVRKLEFARGKIAAYEVMKNAPKEVILVSNAADIAASLSPEKRSPAPPHGANDPKPKKTYKKQAKR